MKNWKKNAVVASILVFVCAGIYLNWMYTQDQETANLTDTLNEEKILGSSTLVMSQTGSLAADAAGRTCSRPLGRRPITLPPSASAASNPGQRRFHLTGGHVLWRGRPSLFRLQGAGGSGRDGPV
ncbi:MAG: hypothetical protein ACLSHU_04915 [Oscillospiraceae bacterium]